MGNFLLYLWQLPQNLLGLILLLLYKDKSLHCKIDDTNIYIAKNFSGGISLGKYIIIRKPYEVTIHHEYGHHKQSLRYGWLYLLVVGLPSLLGNIYDRLFGLTIEQYYNLPWEKQADKLGGIVWVDGKRKIK